MIDFQVDLGDKSRGIVTGIKIQGSAPDKRITTFKVLTGFCSLQYITDVNGETKVCLFQ